MGNLVATSKSGPYWQPANAMRHPGGGLAGGLGASLVLPTVAMAGATGYVVVTVTNPPTAQIQWNSSQTPAVQVWVKDSTGNIQLFSAGSTAAGSGSINWMTAGASGITFYVIPVDANGVQYAPVDKVTVAGAAGIYPSPTTPTSVVTQIQANNLGIQVIGANTTGFIPPAATSTDPFAFLSTLPGGEDVWLGGAALLVLILVMKK